MKWIIDLFWYTKNKLNNANKAISGTPRDTRQKMLHETNNTRGDYLGILTVVSCVHTVDMYFFNGMVFQNSWGFDSPKMIQSQRSLTAGVRLPYDCHLIVGIRGSLSYQSNYSQMISTYKTKQTEECLQHYK